jgi:hypothetical protein
LSIGQACRARRLAYSLSAGESVERVVREIWRRCSAVFPRGSGSVRAERLLDSGQQAVARGLVVRLPRDSDAFEDRVRGAAQSCGEIRVAASEHELGDRE